MEEYGLEALAASAEAVMAGLGPLAVALARLAAGARQAVTLDAMEGAGLGAGDEASVRGGPARRGRPGAG